MSTRTPPEVEIDLRSLRPTAQTPVVPNDNTDIAPGTVGPDVARPGDPDGVVFADSVAAPPNPPSVIKPSRWSGYPNEWDVPLWWGHLEMLSDTAWGCLDLNSSILASMPPYLIGSSASLPDDWLINPDPDRYTSWEEFFKQAAWDYQMGECFILCTARYANTWPARFHVVSPWLVNAEMVGGRRRYNIGALDVTDDLLHIRYQSRTDDAHGHGPLEVGRSRVIAARMLTRYATNLAATGAIPNAVIIHPDELTDLQAAELQQQWVNARLANLGLPAVLSGGITFEALQFSPKDMALIDIAGFNEARISVLLHVPPFLMGLPSGGDPLTYNTVLMALDYHWRAGLRPMAQSMMGALSQWLVPRGTFVELNRDAYVQPEPLVRAQTWEILIRIGVLTAEQVQAIERFSTARSAFIGSGVL